MEIVENDREFKMKREKQEDEEINESRECFRRLPVPPSTYPSAFPSRSALQPGVPCNTISPSVSLLPGADILLSHSLL
jgi:hypothetical protein